MKYNVNQIDAKYDFEIEGTSFIGEPKDYTMMFISKKIKRFIYNLESHKGCLVFVETGIDVPDEYRVDNCICIVDDPQTEYGKISLQLAAIDRELEKNRKIQLTPEGYYIGENVVIGDNAMIEPGCFIGHDVIIGDNARIRYGTTIRNAVIGDNFSCYDHVVIGTDSFYHSEGTDGEYRMPSFGKVIIGNNADFAPHVVIERGFNRDTIIHNYVKLDSNVCIGHDDIIGNNVTINCGSNLAGLVTVEDNVYIGMNAVIKQRVKIAEGSTIGMGAAVIVSVKSGVTVFGNPAKKIGLEI